MNTTAPRMNRKWCFTVNADAIGFNARLEQVYTQHDNVINYICGQLERATTGQIHFQGYCQLKRTQRLSWMQNNVNLGAHYEPQRGTNIQARDYCHKEETQHDNFKEFGTFCEGQGKRTDLVSFRDAILSGSKKIDLLDTHLPEMARYPKFYSMVRALKRPTRTSDLIVRLNYGATGLGKSRFAYDNYSEDLYVIPITSSTLWFDGYDLQSTVLLDDFAGAASKVSLNYTLRLLDRYPQQIPVKGAFTWWMPNLIIITTNIHPRNWYKWEGREGQYKALLRRITEVWWYRLGTGPLRLIGEDRGDFDTQSMLNINDRLISANREEASLQNFIDESDYIMEDYADAFPTRGTPFQTEEDTIMTDIYENIVPM